MLSVVWMYFLIGFQESDVDLYCFCASDLGFGLFLLSGFCARSAGIWIAKAKEIERN